MEDLSARRPADFLEVQHVGMTTLLELLKIIGRGAVAGVDGPNDRGHVAPGGHEVNGSYIPPPWEDGPADGLQSPEVPEPGGGWPSELIQLAAWWAANQPARTLGELLALEPTRPMPPEVLKAVEGLGRVQLREIASLKLVEYDPVARFAHHLQAMDEREHEILLRRSGDEAESLQAVGESLDLTRERIRQLERKARVLLSERLADDSSVVARRTELETALSPMIRPEGRDELLARCFPGLSDCDDPTRRIFSELVLGMLPKLAPWREGWLVIENRRPAVENLYSLRYGDAPVAIADLRAQLQHTDGSQIELDDLITTLGLVARDDVARARPRSLNDRAEDILGNAGVPLDFDDLVARFATDVNARSLRNVLFQDDRFVRTDRDAFGLSSWGVDEYESIVALITSYLVREGGSGSVASIVDEICGRFSVSPRSVRVYSLSDHFVETVDGEIRLREPGEAVVEKRVRPISTFFGCLRIGDRWALRIEVTDQLLKGFSAAMPEPFAANLGVEPLESKLLPTESGHEISIVRKGLQPSVGRLRAVMEELGLGPGALLFVIAPRRLGADVQFLSYTQDVLAEAGDLELAGMELAIEEPVTPRAVVAALDLDDDASLEDALARLRSRGEERLAERLSPLLETPDGTDVATSADVARLLGF